MWFNFKRHLARSNECGNLLSPVYFSRPTGLFLWLHLPSATYPWSQTTKRPRGLSQPYQETFGFPLSHEWHQKSLGLSHTSKHPETFFFTRYISRIENHIKRISKLNILLIYQSSGLDGSTMDENLFSLMVRIWLEQRGDRLKRWSHTCLCCKALCPWGSAEQGPPQERRERDSSWKNQRNFHGGCATKIDSFLSSLPSQISRKKLPEKEEQSKALMPSTSLNKIAHTHSLIHVWWRHTSLDIDWCHHRQKPESRVLAAGLEGRIPCPPFFISVFTSLTNLLPASCPSCHLAHELETLCFNPELERSLCSDCHPSKLK